MWQFDSIREFLAMGNHGPYVWSAFGLFLAVIAVNLISIRWQRARLLSHERKTRAREELRR